MPTSETAAALRQAAAGLTYPSETDAAWVAFAWPDAEGEPTADEVKRRGKHKASAAVQEQTVDDLFAPLVQEQGWYGDEEKAEAARNRALMDAVNRLLATPKVVKVGGRKKAVYVVGPAKDGGWAGLRTTAVET
ncbi:MAG TPA: nuclease A inhibitor family protein [Gemmataceae bacterium]|jgi:hypothetical protein